MFLRSPQILDARRYSPIIGHCMARGMTFIARVHNLWRKLRRGHRIGTIRRVASMNDVPPRLKGAVYIVGPAKPKWVVLECPCKCGERIDVNLMENRNPF